LQQLRRRVFSPAAGAKRRAAGRFRTATWPGPVADSTEAAELAASLEDHGAIVEQDDHVVSVLWPATEADVPEESEEYAFTELIFWL
jgi:hypothetical protein